MMSDHWKSLTRLLGAPSAAEPPEPKRKAEEAKSVDSTSPSGPPRSKDVAENRGSSAAEKKQREKSVTGEAKSEPQKDPLKAMLETPDATTLPGFGESPETSSSSNWDALVKDLDVGTTDAEASEQKESKPVKEEAETDSRTTATSKSPSPRDTQGAAEPKPARQAGGFGAGLGLDLGPEPEPAAPEPAAPEPAAPEPAAPEPAAREREMPKRAAVERPAETEEGEEAAFGGPRRSRRGAQARRRSEEPTEIVDEPAQAGPDEAETVAGDEGFASGLLEGEGARAAGPAKVDEDGERESAHGRRPRRGRRRGVRQRADEEGRPVARRTPEGDSTVDLDDERFGGAEISDRVDEEPTVRRAETDSEEDEDSGPRRRRRRRRRRGGSETRAEAAPSTEAPADEEPASDQKSGPAIDAAFDDDYEDAEELTELRRGRGRRRGRRGGPARGETEAASAGEGEVQAPSQRRGGRLQPTPGEEGAEEAVSTPRPKHRDVVTWYDTVDVLISSNMEKRKREPQRGRGSRNGRSGPRKRD